MARQCSMYPLKLDGLNKMKIRHVSFTFKTGRLVGEVMQMTCCGLHLMPEKSFLLEASSDGKVVCTSVDTCCTGCIEIKCPYSIEKTVTIELSPDDIAREFDDKFFMMCNC